MWEFQTLHNGVLPEDSNHAAELEQIATALLTKAEVNRQALPVMPRELIE